MSASDLSSRRIGLRVAATHAAKQAVELCEAASSMAELLGSPSRARFDVQATWARMNIEAIRRELDDLERMITAEAAAPDLEVAA